MPLLINNISVNQAQVSEIYDSALNARVLGEAMSLPAYVIDEVRRQIRDEGLRYLKPDTDINKTVPFTINHAKNDARKKVTAPSKQVVTDKTPPAQREQTMQQPKTKMTLSDSLLVLLATSKNIMQPQELNATVQVRSDKVRHCLKELLEARLIIRTPNGRYTLSENGEKKVSLEWPNTSIHPNVYKRFDRYTSKAVTKLSKAKSTPKTANKHIEDPTALWETLTNDTEDKSELSQIESELAKLDCSPLKDVDVKVKILHTLSNKLGGKVGEHLTELQDYISH